MEKRLFEQKLSEVAEWKHTEDDPTVVTRLKPVVNEICNICGKTCPGGRQTVRKFYTASWYKFWRSQCLSCKRWDTPSGKWIFDNRESMTEWQSVSRKK